MILLNVPQMRRVTSFVCGWSGECSSKPGGRRDGGPFVIPDKCAQW